MKSHVLNVNDPEKKPKGSIYVGRGHPLGSPYQIGVDGTRDEVLGKYARWLEERINQKDPVVCTALLSIQESQHLICNCAPQSCHAEIIWNAIFDASVKILRESAKREPTLTYAGIGSRSGMSEKTIKIMEGLAERLAMMGYTLNSGHADTSDMAFETGCIRAERRIKAETGVEVSRKHIFLPWAGFNRKFPQEGGVYHTLPVSDAYRVAAIVHPAYEHLKESVQALMARNSHQILGRALTMPVDFVICWTPDGCETHATRNTKTTGGTGQAISLGDLWGVPVVNLYHGKSAVDRISEIVKAAMAWRDEKVKKEAKETG